MNIHTDSLWIGALLKAQLEEVAPVYPLVAEFGAADNFITYRRVDYSATQTKDGYNVDEVLTVELLAVSPSYDSSLILAENIRDRLENKRGVWEGVKIRRIRLVSASEVWRDPNYVQTLIFEIIISH